MRQIEPRLTNLSDESLRRLHRREIRDPREIERLLDLVRSSGTILRNGVNRRNWSRNATVVRHGGGLLGLRVENITSDQPQLFFNFHLDGRAYFFACATQEGGTQGLVVARVPSAIYETERRDLRRVAGQAGAPTRVELRSPMVVARAEVEDFSYQGLGVLLPTDSADSLQTEMGVVFLDGEHAGQERFASVRHSRADDARAGWTRLGLAVSYARAGDPVAVESRGRILENRRSSSWTRIVLAGAPARIASARVARRLGLGRDGSPPKVVEFQNQRGQNIRGILDATTNHAGSTAVLIPPSWGRTKETFLPLAQSIVRTFAASGEDVAVLRFDGTNRRGESYIDPRFRSEGDEYLGFTFSGAVHDIHAALRFLRQDVRPSRVVVVTFSLAAIEGRRAVATDVAGIVSGWVSVVGMVDLQSGLRSVSGGIDFAYGLLEGVRFGRQELVGVMSDMDMTGEDALRNRLVFLEDARMDMASIRVPVTWIHGRHDAWMDLDRVVQLVSSGDTAGRALIEIPTGHQLHSSAEALETFQLVALEVGRVALGKALKPVPPDPVELESATRRERSRRPSLAFDPKSFWRDYLLGRSGDVGFQLLTATSAYRLLMACQVGLLSLESANLVVDVGAGTGELAALLSREPHKYETLRVLELDLVREALVRSRARVAAARVPDVGRVVSDLDNIASSLPVRAGAADAILMSLVVGYVRDPLSLLRSAAACLKSGGRLVVSSMRKDADISGLYVDGISELQPDRLEELFGKGVPERFEALQREFLNSAAHLLDLEHDGRFKFFDADELTELVRSAGFFAIERHEALGTPPQAVVIAARRT